MTQTSSPRIKCPNCGSRMLYVGGAAFRVGGTSGKWKLLFGEWAELGEGMIPMDISICEKCGKMEFYAKKRPRRQFQEWDYGLRNSMRRFMARFTRRRNESQQS